MIDRITSYVAIGDSFSEGLMDPSPDGTPDLFRGWTDRLAEQLVTSPVGSEDLRYANLAIRGRLLEAIIDEQVPRAIELAPDLVSIVGGGNDCMRPNTDIDAVAARFEEAVVALREAGIEVLLGNGFDTKQASPLIKQLRPKVAIYNSHLWTIAQRHGCTVLDMWGLRSLYAPEMWAPDRIHLSSAGHELVADQALAALEGAPLPSAGVRMPDRPNRPIRAVVAEETQWVRRHLAPWVGRRLRGASSGDHVHPKLPELVRVRPESAPGDAEHSA
ncbi:SGNH/GDSL hydrolase family protein [Brevibacterium ihuae]|uniref:SGNH/GDSL hydrolase family protein n=1 Tax=Brevibacterium ihuae TaxID=1631743 RepID=UPI000C77E0D3|nr:SGNH/GDSL hydrolase family protein [Brevibacterium ihuae]